MQLQSPAALGISGHLTSCWCKMSVQDSTADVKLHFSSLEISVEELIFCISLSP